MTLSVADIEEGYGQFDQEYSLEYCLALTGRKADLSVQPIMERWAHLFTPEAIRLVADAEARAPGHERRRWRRLALGLTDKHIAQHVAAIDEEIHTARRTVTVDVDGKAYPFLQIGQMVSVEPDPTRRHQIAAAWRDVQLREISPIGLRIWRARQEAARNLGYRGYAAAYLRLKEMSKRAVQQRAQAVFSNTKPTYRAALEGMLARYASVELPEAADVDMAYALHASMRTSTGGELDPVAAVRATLRGMGLDLQTIPGLEVDLEPRADKAPRAMCFSIDSPRHQVVTCKPQGRYQDVISLMHEMGHALHVAYMDPALPVPLRTVWERGTTEACAYLLEYLATDPDWMMRILGLDRAEATRLARIGELRQMYLARKMAGQALYDFDLDANPTTAEEAYVTRMQAATGLITHPASYSVGDDELYAAGYLEAFLLHQHMMQGLKRQFGPGWWHNRGAGVWLQSQIWRRGMDWNAAEFIAACGATTALKSGWFSA